MMKIVIFGASEGGIKTYRMLASIGIECVYFADNSQSKWGTYLEEKEVKSPESLHENKYLIVIASVYYEEIEQQLVEMQIEPERVRTRESFVKEILDAHMEQYEAEFSKFQVPVRERSIIIDLDHGLHTGGIESWSFLVAKESKNECIATKIYTDNDYKEVPYGLSNNIKHMDLSKNNFEKEILNITRDMIFMLPCIFIANWMEQSFWASYILKNIFPNDVYIIGMVHHDMRGYYKRNQYLQNCIDNFLCVSTDTRIKMIKEYYVPEKKVFYKEAPIEIEQNIRKDNEVLMIGIGARLDKAKKRVDLLIPLIRELESQKVEYQFLIAGDGSYYLKLKEFIESNNLINKIHLLGNLKIEQMKEFWKKIDVVVSTSDSEGMGLSILEGMGAGAVPVVTNTAGIKEFVNKENGYVVEINDIKTMASHLKELSENREKVIRMGKNSRKVIEDKCSLKGYIDYIKKSVE